jgi:hypothetical protein
MYQNFAILVVYYDLTLIILFISLYDFDQSKIPIHNIPSKQAIDYIINLSTNAIFKSISVVDLNLGKNCLDMRNLFIPGETCKNSIGTSPPVQTYNCRR